MITKVITDLNNNFVLKNLGSICYFLGFRVHRDNLGILLIKSKYILDLLSKANMENAKGYFTHTFANAKLFLNDNMAFDFDQPYICRSISCPITCCDNIGVGSLASKPVFYSRIKKY